METEDDVDDDSAKNVYEIFEKAYRHQRLREALHSSWAEFVPAIIKSLMTPMPSEEVSAVDENMLEPLLRFVCGGKDPESVFGQQKHSSSTLCGHVFKAGEPNYSCRQCATDPTCVLCIDCFQGSIHKSHQYKMSTSGGGGCCDCGDVEAWSAGYYCETHKPIETNTTTQSSNSGPQLPDAIEERIRAVFKIILEYCYEMLVWSDGESFPTVGEDYLMPRKWPSTFCTMVFNDEIHTFDQVIETLKLAVDNCTQKDAVAYATAIDREGRSCVMADKRSLCIISANVITKHTPRMGKGLKVIVMNTLIVEHQNFAIRLLDWLADMMKQSAGMRDILCEELLKAYTDDLCIVELAFLSDTKLWKCARSHWHDLMIASLFMDLTYKKIFAGLFTRHYAQLQQDFMDDDHDRSVSAASLSVQIYTVPSIAKYLIEQHDLLSVLLTTLLQQCVIADDTTLSGDSQPTFDRDKMKHNLETLQYIAADIKYLLASKPTEWNPLMRSKFIEAIQILLLFLASMQGFDAVVRQASHHIEFEQEWETAFNFQMRMTPLLTMVLSWAASDKEVFVKVFKIAVDTLVNLDAHIVNIPVRNIRVGKCNADCLDYDVSKQQVSLHQPLTRFIAGLTIHLDKFHLHYGSPEFSIKSWPKPIHLMERSLRTSVMVGQVNAGMWKRNGISLQNQIYYYHSIQCRSEMFDRDIVMLQSAASAMPSNDFLLSLLNRFNLLSWLRDDYDKTVSAEDQLTVTIVLMEEFLGLVIMIVSERFTPGVGLCTNREKEIHQLVQQLCIKPLTRSELTKALPEDKHHPWIDNVINEVAVIVKSSHGSKATFHLKPECVNMYNPHYYHYSKIDTSKAEEACLKMNAGKVGNSKGYVLAPLDLPAFTTTFSGIVDLLHCDVLVYIIKTVLHRVSLTWSRSWAEGLIQKALYLTSLALKEELRLFKEDPCSPKQLLFCSKISSTKSGLSIKEILLTLVGSPRVEICKDFLTYVIKLVSEVHVLKYGAETDMSRDTKRPNKTLDPASDRQKTKADKARLSREKMMSQMKALQNHFIEKNLESFEGTLVGSDDFNDEDVEMSVCPDEVSPVCTGAMRSSTIQPSLSTVTCILCQEMQDISPESRAVVLSAFLQRSSVLSKKRDQLNVSDQDREDLLFTPATLNEGVHMNTCGHAMHWDCWQNYFQSILVKEQRRPRRHFTNFDIEKREFLCPLCRFLSNTVIPMLPIHVARPLPSETDLDSSINLNKWIEDVSMILKNSQKENEISDVETVNSPPSESLCRMLQIVNPDSTDLSDSVCDMVKLFATNAYTVGVNDLPNPHDDRIALFSWLTCAYTIHNTVHLLRFDEKPLVGSLNSRQSLCLSNLTRFAAMSITVHESEHVRKHCLALLNAILTLSESEVSIFELDMFTVMVYLCLSISSLRQSDEPLSPLIHGAAVFDQHVLSLSFTAHVVQILLLATLKYTGDEELMDEDGPHGSETEEAVSLLSLYNYIKDTAGIVNNGCPQASHLLSHLITSSIPFLSCATLFFHFITGVPIPVKHHLGRPECELELFHDLCNYLGLSSLTDICQIHVKQTSSPYTECINRWLRHPLLKQRLSLDNPRVVSYPVKVNTLQKLPEDFSDFINSVAMFRCPKFNGAGLRAPTMCLICGDILCSQSYCCQTEVAGGVMVGACIAHSLTCGAGIGLYLRVRDCQVLLIHGLNRGIYQAPPYVDHYGETDQGLRRGNPLHLCHDAYMQLQKLWLMNGIPEKVSMSLEFPNNLEWQVF